MISVKANSYQFQLYDIMRREILKGRWGIGDQLPSYNDLSEASGLSRTPVQDVYNRLEADGYISRVRQKGIFLKSTTPDSNKTIGTIVFIVQGSEPRIVAQTQTFGNWDLESMIETARGRGFGAEIVTIAPAMSHSGVHMVNLKSDVIGIVSLVSKDTLESQVQGINAPVVFLGVDDAFSYPSIDGDLMMTSYLLTQELIRLNHKNIAIFSTPTMGDKQVEDVLDGHRKAMAAADLSVNTDFLDWSHQLEEFTLMDMKSIFSRFKEVTAVLCMRGDAANKIVEVADFMEINIPDELSIASCQVTYLRGNRDLSFLGVYYDWEAIIDRCFDILLDPESKANLEMLRQINKPHVKVKGSPTVNDLEASLG